MQPGTERDGSTIHGCAIRPAGDAREQRATGTRRYSSGAMVEPIRTPAAK